MYYIINSPCKTVKTKYVQLRLNTYSQAGWSRTKQNLRLPQVKCHTMVVLTFSFPTIYWAPKNGKDKPQKYEGGREVADFMNFIKTKASDPADLPKEGKKSKKDDEAL